MDSATNAVTTALRLANNARFPVDAHDGKQLAAAHAGSCGW